MIIDEKFFNKVASLVVLGALFILAFLILRPILISSLFALILAFIFYPVHSKLYKLIRSKNLSAFIICVVLLAIIIVPLVLSVPFLAKQVLSIYSFVQGETFAGPIHDFLSGFFSSEEIADNIVIYLNYAVSYASNYMKDAFKGFIFNSPSISLHVVLILFVFFFGLRDGDKLVAYIQSLSPLTEESEKKVFGQFKDITYSVVYGQIVIGIIQGLLTGIALFIFKIPNPIVLTLIATFLGILPIIGPSLVWVPVDIYLLLKGDMTGAILLFFYGFLIISGIDNVLRPLIVGKKTKINSGVILVSMIGGLFVFGLLGLIIGPLVIAYLLLILETYRKTKDKKYKEIFIHTEK
jgi:predicted PurR-regulated permease PerM